MLRDSFKNLLKEERTYRGWSRERMAVELEVSFSTITNWEIGRSFPPADEFDRLCDRFGWTVSIGGPSRVSLKPRKAQARHALPALAS
jgi:transcriptional regulator with XRE-family HTH domain